MLLETPFFLKPFIALWQLPLSGISMTAATQWRFVLVPGVQQGVRRSHTDKVSPSFSKPVAEAGDDAGPAGGLHQPVDDLWQRGKGGSVRGEQCFRGAHRRCPFSASVGAQPGPPQKKGVRPHLMWAPRAKHFNPYM